jgi:hypothetical protein
MFEFQFIAYLQPALVFKLVLLQNQRLKILIKMIDLISKNERSKI